MRTEVEADYFSEPLELSTGEHRVDESLSVKEVAGAVQHYFSDSLFFPYQIFSPRSLYFPDTYFDEMELGEDEAGILFAPVRYDSEQELADENVPVDPISISVTVR